MHVYADSQFFLVVWFLCSHDVANSWCVLCGFDVATMLLIHGVYYMVLISHDVANSWCVSVGHLFLIIPISSSFLISPPPFPSYEMPRASEVVRLASHSCPYLSSL